MKRLLALFAVLSLVAATTHAAAIVDTTYTTDTSLGTATEYFLEGDTGGTTATWTINPDVTVTGGKFYIGSNANPNLGLATFVVDGGGTLDIDRDGVYNLRLGQGGDANSEGGALIIKNGSSVLMTGTTPSAFEQHSESFISLDGLGSTFQWSGDWNDVTSKVHSQGADNGSDDIPLSVTGGTLQITSADGFTTATVIPEPATLGMVAVFGGGILFIRRKLMM